MNLFLSILRGINVSGKNKLVMTDLKKLYENLGFQEVCTYIQSGNVIFKSLDASYSQTQLSQIIELQIAKDFGYKVPILIQNQEELQNIVKINPFLAKPAIEMNKLHVTFLESIPEKSKLEKTYQTQSGADQFEVVGKHIFLYCPDGYGNTKYSNQFFESKLQVTATTRNWKTITHLLKMMESYSA